MIFGSFTSASGPFCLISIKRDSLFNRHYTDNDFCIERKIYWVIVSGLEFTGCYTQRSIGFYMSILGVSQTTACIQNDPDNRILNGVLNDGVLNRRNPSA